MSNMPETRDNHYVPQWYQRGFFSEQSNKLRYLDRTPDTKPLADGRVMTMNYKWNRPTSQCFYQTDLYPKATGNHKDDFSTKGKQP